MAYSIPNVYVRTYERNVLQLAQQGDNRLRAWCMERQAGSVNHNWETLDAGTAVLKATTGRIATPDADTQFGRRISLIKTFHINDFVEPEAIAQTLISPVSALAESHAMAMRRAHDNEIVTNATGASLGQAGSVGFDTTNQQLNAAGTAEISFDLITATTEIFNRNDVDPDEPKCFVIGPKQARKLLQLTEANSGDFNAMRPLQSKGYVDNWMGYTWIMSNRLALNSSVRECFAMTKKAIGFHVAKDIWSRAEEDPSASYDIAVYTASSFGAVRVQDKHLVWVRAADTVT